MTATRDSAQAVDARAWRIVAGRELRGLWLAGRGLPLMVGYAVVLSVSSYLAASNRALNFLEQREAVDVTLEVAVAVAALVVLAAAADAISGERDRGTLESLLVTPMPRVAVVVGKGAAALSLWAAAFAVSLPYVLYLGRGTHVTAAALFGGFAIGLLLALFVTGFGLLVSAVTPSSRASLAATFFVLLALYAPTQMPSGHTWIGNFLTRLDPFTAGLHYLSGLVVNASGFRHDLSWLLGPAVLALGACGAALAAGRRLELRPGDGS